MKFPASLAAATLILALAGAANGHPLLKAADPAPDAVLASSNFAAAIRLLTPRCRYISISRGTSQC